MTEQALIQLVRQVMLDAARLEYGGLKKEQPEHLFSPAFERKMKKLLRRGRHPLWNKTLRAAACLLLSLLLSGCAVLAVSLETREVFSGWIWEIHETYFLYRFFEDGENGTLSEEDVLYQPAYVPSGYRIEYRGVVNGMAVVFYINDESGALIDFQYFTDLGSSVVQVVQGSGISYKKVLVNGKSAVLHLEEGETNVLVWVNEENRLAFTFSGVSGGEELIKMAESVRAIPRGQFFRPAWLSEGYYEVSAKDCLVKGLGLPHGLEVGESVLSYKNGKDGYLTVAYAHEFEITGLRPDRCEADAVSVQVGETPAFLFLDREKTII